MKRFVITTYLMALGMSGLGVQSLGAMESEVFKPNEEKIVMGARGIAESGRGFEHYMIGLKYLEGKEVKADVTEALRWFRRGASMGDEYSQIILVEAYARGEGVVQNRVEAAAWWQWLKTIGSKHTFDADLVKDLSTASPAQVQARLLEIKKEVAEGEALAKARFEATKRSITLDDLHRDQGLALKGDLAAMTRIGEVYTRSWGVERDLAESCAWWSIASARGDAAAKARLQETQMNLTAAERDALRVRLAQLQSDLQLKPVDR